MLKSVRNILVAFAFMGIACLAVGCGGTQDKVMEQTPESQAALDDYNKEMDKPSSGI